MRKQDVLPPQNSTKMTHEEHIEKQRQRVCEVTKGMLDGSTHYLEGAIELCSLRHQVEAYESDEAFEAFILVESETDHLPLGTERKYWSELALERHEHEIEELVVWAKEVSLAECKSLLERFRA